MNPWTFKNVYMKRLFDKNCELSVWPISYLKLCRTAFSVPATQHQRATKMLFTSLLMSSIFIHALGTALQVTAVFETQGLAQAPSPSTKVLSLSIFLPLYFSVSFLRSLSVSLCLAVSHHTHSFRSFQQLLRNC